MKTMKIYIYINVCDFSNPIDMLVNQLSGVHICHNHGPELTCLEETLKIFKTTSSFRETSCLPCRHVFCY